MFIYYCLFGNNIQNSITALIKEHCLTKEETLMNNSNSVVIIFGHSHHFFSYVFMYDIAKIYMSYPSYIFGTIFYSTEIIYKMLPLLCI